MIITTNFTSLSLSLSRLCLRQFTIQQTQQQQQQLMNNLVNVMNNHWSKKKTPTKKKFITVRNFPRNYDWKLRCFWKLYFTLFFLSLSSTLSLFSIASMIDNIVFLFLLLIDDVNIITNTHSYMYTSTTILNIK